MIGFVPNYERRDEIHVHKKACLAGWRVVAILQALISALPCYRSALQLETVKPKPGGRTRFKNLVVFKANLWPNNVGAAASPPIDNRLVLDTRVTKGRLAPCLLLYVRTALIDNDMGIFLIN